MKKVYVLTWCKNINQLYGSVLVFDTIRIGFPTAEIVVIDNGSIPDAVIEIEKAANKVNAQFFKLDDEIAHHTHIPMILNAEHNNTHVYIIDPDVIFWGDVKWYSTDKLLAGRFIPEFLCGYTNLRLRETHKLALETPITLKGLWREQHAFFLSTLNTL